MIIISLLLLTVNRKSDKFITFGDLHKYYIGQSAFLHDLLISSGYAYISVRYLFVIET